MSGPVYASLAATNDALAEKYAAFRAASEGALAAELVTLIRQAVAAVHGLGAAPDESALDEATRACIAYARRIPFEHTAITDTEAAGLVAHLGEPGFVAFSVITALADAECRAGQVDLPGLTTA
jgi:hypothetical protein